MSYKMINAFVLTAGILFLGACSLDLRIPNGMPPQIVIPPKEEIKVEEPTVENPALEPGRNVMVEVLLPDSERKTEALLEQYKENLENLEKNLD